LKIGSYRRNHDVEHTRGRNGVYRFVYLDYTSQQGFIFQEGMHGIITQMPDLETFSATIDKYHLLPRNATHLSIIFSLNIPNIVTTDADFDKVKEIKVWKP